MGIGNKGFMTVMNQMSNYERSQILNCIRSSFKAVIHKQCIVYDSETNEITRVLTLYKNAREQYMVTYYTPSEKTESRIDVTYFKCPHAEQKSVMFFCEKRKSSLVSFVESRPEYKIVFDANKSVKKEQIFHADVDFNYLHQYGSKKPEKTTLEVTVE